jgi:hypothetical protein
MSLVTGTLLLAEPGMGKDTPAAAPKDPSKTEQARSDETGTHNATGARKLGQYRAAWALAEKLAVVLLSSVRMCMACIYS